MQMVTIWLPVTGEKTAASIDFGCGSSCRGFGFLFVLDNFLLSHKHTVLKIERITMKRQQKEFSRFVPRKIFVVDAYPDLAAVKK